jgi:transposase
MYNLNVISFNIGIEIYTYLNTEDEKKLSQTCRNMRYIYKQYIIPKPQRDVFIDITDMSKNPIEYNFKQIKLDKFNRPTHVEFSKNLVPCDNCDSSILCILKKLCLQCN